MSLINLYQAAVYTKKGLHHQQKAWDYLTESLSEQQMLTFADLFRTSPNLPVVESPTSNPHIVTVPTVSTTYKDSLKLLSQRDNRGGSFDSNDWVQTCIPTSMAMIINAYNNTNVQPSEIDQSLIKKYGSRYSHDNAVKVFRDYGLKSVFSTTTLLSSVKDHLATGNLAMMSWLITNSGHIVVLADYKNGKFLVYDPYGEPNITPNNKPVYVDKRNPYWVSEAAVKRYSANTPDKIWCHKITKKS